jgi:hypothetical protein
MAWTHGDIAKIDVQWYASGIGFAANVFQAKLLQDSPHSISDSYTTATMKDWIERVMAPMETHVVVDVDIVQASIYRKVGPLWNLQGTTSIVFVPASIGDPLPSGVAALIRAKTYVSKVEGKKYLPGLSELSQTAGLWVAGVLSDLALVAVQWISGFDDLSDSTSHWYPGVWSLKTLDFQSFAPDAVIPDVPAYQRRRKQGVGI